MLLAGRGGGGRALRDSSESPQENSVASSVAFSSFSGVVPPSDSARVLLPWQFVLFPSTPRHYATDQPTEPRVGGNPCAPARNSAGVFRSWPLARLHRQYWWRVSRRRVWLKPGLSGDAFCPSSKRVAVWVGLKSRGRGVRTHCT